MYAVFTKKHLTCSSRGGKLKNWNYILYDKSSFAVPKYPSKGELVACKINW